MIKKADVLCRKLVLFFVLITLIIFPLFYQHYYFDILPAKYKFYYITCIVMLVGVLVLELISLLGNRRQEGNKVVTLPTSEYALIIFGIVAVISTIQSDYKFEAFWGNEGRYTGLFLILLYILSYFAVRKFLIVKQYILDAFLLSGSLAAIWGIADYFQMDVMGFKQSMLDSQKAVFFSSMGNINTYTAFVGMVMAIATILYLMTKNNVKRSLFYYVCMLISFVAIITGNSDNAYLSIGILFALIPVFCCNSESRIRRYAIIWATFFSAIQLIDWINHRWQEQVIGLNSLFDVISNSRMLLPLVVLLWGVVLAWFLIRRNANKENNEYKGYCFRNIWIFFLFCVFALVLYAIYDCNWHGNVERYGALSGYLYFDDHWGSDRGIIWKLAINYFNNFPFFRKIVGFGPDTFGILMVINDKSMINQTGIVFDNVHNEYLQLLITVGGAGLLSYLSFGITSLSHMFKTAINNPVVVACAFAVLCYSAQALVNIGLPITAPFMWLFLAIGMAACCNQAEQPE